MPTVRYCCCCCRWWWWWWWWWWGRGEGHLRRLRRCRRDDDDDDLRPLRRGQPPRSRDRHGTLHCVLPRSDARPRHVEPLQRHGGRSGVCARGGGFSGLPPLLRAPYRGPSPRPHARPGASGGAVAPSSPLLLRRHRVFPGGRRGDLVVCVQVVAQYSTVLYCSSYQNVRLRFKLPPLSFSISTAPF